MMMNLNLMMIIVKNKIEVSLFIGGNIHKETVIVDRFEDAAAVALARKPTAKVVNRTIMM